MLNNEGVPKIFKIDKVIRECDSVTSIFFKGKVSIVPGQFVMVWIPSVDEKPFAISYVNANGFGITSHAVGPYTKVFDKLRKGDKVGIRGPYGNGFKISKKAIVVSGGIGISSVSTLIDALINPIVLAGFRSSKHVCYSKRYSSMKIATDDGTVGHHGFVTDLLVSELNKGKVDMVYTCGPEIMMKKVFEICESKNVSCQASLERYMKCGFGICGNCMCDDKIVCVDGPVFGSSELSKLKDFGNYARMKTGRKVTLKEYYGGR
jgi:dihydroorotate dehydrogenase electron transfer subunit